MSRGVVKVGWLLVLLVGQGRLLQRTKMVTFKHIAVMSLATYYYHLSNYALVSQQTTVPTQIFYVRSCQPTATHLLHGTIGDLNPNLWFVTGRDRTDFLAW